MSYSTIWHQLQVMEQDMTLGKFDTTLAKYQLKSDSPLTLARCNFPTHDLLELWDLYAEYKKTQVSVTHYQTNYQLRYRNAVAELPTKSVKDAATIRDHLLKTRTASTAKQLLTQFNACCKWAVKSGLIKDNPFDGMASDIRVKATRSHEDINPFTSKERDAIITAFEAHPYHKHYAPFVKFLFLTGCRTSEAVGLRWGDINSGCTLITFSSAIVKGVRKSTKTGKSRKFPCNQQLKTLLIEIRPEKPNDDALVFPNPEGRPIDPATFIHNSWGGEVPKGTIGIVRKLAEDGKIACYRPQYNTRHTFITECLQQGITLPQIARWVGNSPGTLLAHYGGVTVAMHPPEI